MMEILSFGFMQRALAAGVLIALACSALGVFLVLRRESLVGHGLADVAFGGIALGLLLSLSPLGVALASAVACALWIVRSRRGGLADDTSIGIVANGGLAAGIILASLGGRFSAELLSYLFGNLLAISPVEVAASAVLAGGVLAAIILHYQDLVALAFDRDMAVTSGVRASSLEALLAVLTAVTVVLAMKVVGILLVSALLVIPAATVLPWTPSFRGAVAGASVVGVAGVLGGLFAAYHLDLPAAGGVVATLLLLFAIPRAAARLGLHPRGA